MPLVEAVDSVREFLETGGEVLVLVLGVTLLMWTLIVERFLYLRWGHPAEVERVCAAWERRRDRSSPRAHQVRRLLLSELRLGLGHSLPVIRTLVAVCPLIGVLGTVTGMIEVFEVLAVSGGANARALADGVSRAAIPTMAGMVAALSGFIVSMQMDRFARREVERVGDRLTHR